MEKESPPVLRENSNGNWELPSATKVQGILLQPGPPADLTEVSIQYGSAQTQKWCEVRMSLEQALYLAGLLEQMRDDPRVVSILRKNL